MSGWIIINDLRLDTKRIVRYSLTDANPKSLHISYFNGVAVVPVFVEHHYLYHTKRLDALFNIERSPNAKVPKTDARPVASISRR